MQFKFSLFHLFRRVVDLHGFKKTAQRHLPGDRQNRFAELFGRTFAGTLQRIVHRRRYCTADRVIILEADFPFGGMNIDIHIFGRHVDEKDRRCITPRIGQRSITVFQAPVDCRCFDRTAVDKCPLFVTGVACEAGCGDETGDVHIIFLMIHRPHIFGKLFPEKFTDACRRSRRTGRVESQTAIQPQFKTDLPAGQGHGDDHFLDVVGLGRRGTEEFPPCRSIVKEITHQHGRADCSRRRSRAEKLAALDFDADTFDSIGGTGGHGETADRSDRRQSLSAETKCCDMVDLLFGEKFACAVRFQTEQGIIGIHAAAVIADADQAAARPFDFDADAFCSGINGVFHQFFYYGSGAFNDFACGDTVAQLLRHDSDFAHFSSPLPSGRALLIM